jgi:Acyl-CoA synthetase (NDP forming)
VGFSAFVSLGSMLDVSWGDLIYQLGDDPHTSAIVMYMESVVAGMTITTNSGTTVPAIVRECAESGVKHVVIISAGFKEVGPEGVALEQDILATARKAGMRIIGPNCLGVMAPTAKLNATFAAGMARPGHVAFLS